MMRDELAAKVKKLSNDLVTALQIRDMVLVESDTKNKFIAALLRVKDRRHSLRNQHQEASSGGLRSWSRPRSLSRGLDWVKRRGSLLEDEKSNDLVRNHSYFNVLTCGTYCSYYIVLYHINQMKLESGTLNCLNNGLNVSHKQ